MSLQVKSGLRFTSQGTLEWQWCHSFVTTWSKGSAFLSSLWVSHWPEAAWKVEGEYNFLDISVPSSSHQQRAKFRGRSSCELLVASTHSNRDGVHQLSKGIQEEQQQSQIYRSIQIHHLDLTTSHIALQRLNIAPFQLKWDYVELVYSWLTKVRDDLNYGLA